MAILKSRKMTNQENVIEKPADPGWAVHLSGPYTQEYLLLPYNPRPASDFLTPSRYQNDLD